MVKTRGKTSFAELQKAKSLEWFVKFGRSDIVLINRTEVEGSDGRLTNVEISRMSVIGDLQFDMKTLSQYIQLGIAESGDGVFYTTADLDINKNDEILVDNIYWRLVSQVEGEQTNGVTIYQGWLCKKRV